MDNDKHKYYKIARELKTLIEKLKNESMQESLKGLSPSYATDYYLWKATRKLKRPLQSIPPRKYSDDLWARSDLEKATTCAEHLSKVFEPFPPQMSRMEEENIRAILVALNQMDLPIKKK